MEDHVNIIVAIVEKIGELPDVARLLDHFAWVEDLDVIEAEVIEELQVPKLIEGQNESAIEVLQAEVHDDLVGVGPDNADSQ